MNLNCYNEEIHKNINIRGLHQDDSIICKLNNLLSFECECRYYSQETNENMKEKYRVTGNYLSNWHKRHRIQPISVFNPLNVSVVETFLDLIDFCKDKNSITRCDHFPQSVRHMDCYCFDKNTIQMNIVYKFKFSNVFIGDNDYFCSEISTNKSGIFPSLNDQSASHENNAIKECIISYSLNDDFVLIYLSLFFLIFALLAIWLYNDFKNFRKGSSSVVTEMNLNNEV